MATKEEAREAPDGEEVQVEAVDLGTAHLQKHLDGKLSSNKEIKDEAKTMDSTEGMLKLPEDQILVEAPSEIEIPPEHNPNDTASSLNGHMEKEETILNEQPHENNQKDEDQVEAKPDGTSNSQSNNSNHEDVNDSLSHGEGITLLKYENEEPKEHDQQHLEDHVMDDSKVQEDTLKIDNDVQKTVDVQQGQDLPSAKATEDAQLATVPDDKVVAEVQTPLEPNVDDSDVLQDTTDGNKERDEPNKADNAVRLDHKESFPEDKGIAEHTEEAAKVDDQQSKKAHDVDADVLQEERKIEETGVQEEMPVTEKADESIIDAQEVLNQELPEKTSDPVSEKTEETSHESNMEASEETTPEDDAMTREPAADIQEVQNQGLVEERTGAEKVDAEKTMQQSSVAFEEVIPEDHVATTEPRSKIQHVYNVESEDIKGFEDAKDEETPNQSNAASEAIPEDHVATTKPSSKIQHVYNVESEDIKGFEDAKDEETPNQSNAASEEAEDHVATTETSSEIQHVHNVESEDIKGVEDSKAEETPNQSNVAFTEDTIQDKDVLPSEPTAETQPVQGLEQEETNSTGTVEMDETSNQTLPDVFNNLAEKDVVAASEPQVTESEEEVKDTEATETQEITHQCHAAASEELATEDNSAANEPHNDDIQQAMEQGSIEVKDTEAAETKGICHESTLSASEKDTVEDDVTAEEPTCNAQEVQNVGSAEEIKDNIAENIVEVSDVATPEEEDQENNVLTSEDIAEQKIRGLEPEQIEATEPVEIEESSSQRHASPFNDPAQEDITTPSEMQKTESAEEVKEIEATKIEAIPQESNVSISEEPTPEDITASGIACDPQELNNVELAEDIKGNKDTKSEETSDGSNGIFAGEAAQGNNDHASEPTVDTQSLSMHELETEEMKNTELVDMSEATDQMDAAILENPIQEYNPGTSELHVMESVGEVSNNEATKGQETPHESDVAQSEDQATEENTTASEPQILEPESVEEMKDIEATEPGGISQQIIISTSEESVPEEDATAKEPGYDNKEDQNEEPEPIKEHDDVKAEKRSDQSSGDIFGEAAQENKLVLASNPTNDVQVEELEFEEIRNTEDVGTEEASRQTKVADAEENLTASEMKGIEPIRPEPALHEGKVASLEGISTNNAMIGRDVGIQQLQKQESVGFRNMEAVEPQGISPSQVVSTSECTPEDNVTTEPSADTQAENLESATVAKNTEGAKSNVVAEEATPEEQVLAFEETVDLPPLQEPELEETKNTEPVGMQDNITSDLEAEKVKDTEAIPHDSTVETISELTKDEKSNVALADKATPEEHVLATEATVDIPSAQEPELEEIKNTEPVVVEDNMTASDLPAEEMKDTVAMETEAIPHESTIASIKELTEDDILTASVSHADIQGEPQQSIVSTSDKLTPTGEKITVTEPTYDIHVQHATAEQIKDSEDVKTEEFSDCGIFSTPEVAAQESGLLRSEPTSDVQQVQERDSTEETRGIEAAQTEDHQQNGVSTLEKPVPENNVIESEPNIDEQKVQEDKSAVQVKDIEAMETEETSNRSNITTTENSAQGSSELENDPDFYVQSAQQLESAEDSTGSQLVQAEGIAKSNGATLEELTAEDNSANEIDQPVDIKQENELELVEGNKGIEATEAEEASHIIQDDALEEPASESNIATAEPTNDDIQQVSDLEEAKEIKGTDAINDEEISCQQTEVAILENPSPTDNGMAPKEHPVDSNEENLGNEISNVTLVNAKITDEIQEPTELKDESSDLGDKTVFTNHHSEDTAEEDDVQIPGVDTIEDSKNIEQTKEESKAVAEHDSSQVSSDQREENITHVQDRDINGELLLETGTAEASQASFEKDPQEAQDVAEKDDTIKSGEHINDRGNEQLHDVVLQAQVCERSMDALAIGQQDEDVQVNLDQQQKEIEKMEVQKEETQRDEHKHDDKKADFTTEPLVEPQGIEIVTTNRTEDTDVFEADRTETVVTEMLKNENTLHIPQDSIPTITDGKVENIAERKEGTEEENGPNKTGPLDVDAENHNEDEHEDTENDVGVEKAYTDEHDETTGEIRNEEVEPGLSSSVEKDLQEISDPTSSNDEMLENNPTVAPQNFESGIHRKEKECPNEVSDDMHAIQESEKEMVDEVQEMQNEDNVVRCDDFQTKPDEKEASQLHSNEPYNVDNKMDDSLSPDAEIIHGKSGPQPRETKEIEENKGISSISESVVETSKENNAEQDLSIHHKVADEKLATTEHNGVEVEAMQQKIDSSNAETNDDDDVLSIGNPLPEHGTETVSDINQSRQYQEVVNVDDALQLEPEENVFDKIAETESSEKTDTSYTAATEAVKFNEDISDKASGADGALSDDNHETFEDTRRDLDVSSVENTTEQASGLEETEKELSLLPEKPLPAEQKEHKESQITKEQDEEDVQEKEIGDTQKEAEQSDLPVSHFLMNLILGKESNDPNGSSEFEDETKHEETTKDEICLITSQQEESFVPFPTENKIHDKLNFEQEKQNVESSEETHETVKEQSRDFKLDTERSVETDEGINRNTHHMEAPRYQENTRDEVSSELVPGEAAGLITKMESRDFKMDERAVYTIYQEDVEATTQIEGSLKSNLDDSRSPKASQEDTIEEGRTALLHESLPEDRSHVAVSEQTVSSTEPDMGGETKLLNDTDDLQSFPCKQEEPIESSIIEAKSNIEVRMESEMVDKKEENQQITIGGATEEQVEILQDNPQKSKDSEAISDEQAPELTEPVIGTEINLVQEKEISAGSTCMDEKQSYNFSNNEVGNFKKALEIQSDGPKLHINQDKQDESSDNQILMENNLLDKPRESNLQKEQETNIAQKSPTESDQGGHHFSAISVNKEENAHETVESSIQTVNIKSNKEQEAFDSQVQERDLDVVSPKEAPKVEENFVEVTKPEFSTDEEQSPKADESDMTEEKTYDEKTKDEQETENFTDEAATKIKERGAGQKASPKKHNILSGVGSKVKHQLAKVKKAIIGKPGHTKPESLKS